LVSGRAGRGCVGERTGDGGGGDRIESQACFRFNALRSKNHVNYSAAYQKASILV
jgi:hypothetical protein